MKPKSAFVEEKIKVGEEGNCFEETMTRDEKRTSYDGEDIIKGMEPILEYMTNNIMKGFELLAIQSWEKYIDFKKTKGENASVCLKEKNEETHEPPSFVIGEVEEVVHEEDINSLPSDSKKYEETSHKYEEFFIENTERNFETHATLEMKQRASTDGCLNYEGVP